MWSDIVDLDEFYRSRLGQVASRLLRRRIRTIWPSVRGETVVGIGYAAPYLRPFVDEAARVVAVMPAQQGVHHWPRAEPNRVLLAEECELPLGDRSVDRLLLVHAVECSEQLRPMLREAWRVLADGGRALVVAPNRTGIWARTERTPFGYGHPYSAGQLKRLLRDCLFTPRETAHALFLPPVNSRVLLHSAVAVERLAARWFQPIAGVVLVEAEKQLYAATPVRAAAPARRRGLIALPGGTAAARGMRRDGERR